MILCQHLEDFDSDDKRLIDIVLARFDVWRHAGGAAGMFDSIGKQWDWVDWSQIFLDRRLDKIFLAAGLDVNIATGCSVAFFAPGRLQADVGARAGIRRAVCFGHHDGLWISLTARIKVDGLFADCASTFGQFLVVAGNVT
tara:strand:+ start:821 stop:1243 length:423 start_codon:yes stop_codon:yes gene_type:complete